MKTTSGYWGYVLFAIIFYLAYQTYFVWETAEQATIPDNQVLFVTVNEKHFGVGQRSFSSLMEKFKIWDYDAKTKTVSIKFDAQMPRKNTIAMLIYDRGFDSFDKYAEVLPINKIPYQYNFQNQPLLTIDGQGADGTAYLEFEGKKIKLKPGQTYHAWSFSEGKVSRNDIHNYGFYKKDQFVLMKPDPTEQQQQSQEQNDTVEIIKN